MSVILVPRTVGPVPVDVILLEGHSSRATISEHPIEDGSSVNDHAYIEPKRLTLEVADEKAADTYIEFVNVQELREPFDVVSGLAVYTNMMIEGIEAKRDKRTYRILMATIYLREIVIVGGKPGSVSSNFDELPPTVGPTLDPVVFDKTAPISARGDAVTTIIAAGSVVATNILTGALG